MSNEGHRLMACFIIPHEGHRLLACFIIPQEGYKLLAYFIIPHESHKQMHVLSCRMKVTDWWHVVSCHIVLKRPCAVSGRENPSTNYLPRQISFRCLYSGSAPCCRTALSTCPASWVEMTQHRHSRQILELDTTDVGTFRDLELGTTVGVLGNKHTELWL